MIVSLKRKLSTWKGRILSIGCRVEFLNSVLSNMPRYQLYFYNVLHKVVKEIIVIQRMFLWQGVEEKKGMAQVSWDINCQSKK